LEEDGDPPVWDYSSMRKKKTKKNRKAYQATYRRSHKRDGDGTV